MMLPLKTLVTAALVLLGLCSATAEAAGDRKPNVLFIAVDDLRPELGCYGRSHMHTPHLDRLASRGMVFQRAYCMVPTCGASRASLFTGIRPASNRFTSYQARADREAPGIKTLNTHFRENGYHTVSLGKVLHVPDDNVHGWSEKPWRADGYLDYHTPENQKLHAERQKLPGSRKRGPAWEAADAPEENYADANNAARAVADLRRLAKSDQPFFLAVGFYRPHLPFVAPKKYWDLYDHDKIQLPETYHVPQDAPAVAVHGSGELRAYSNISSKRVLEEETARNLIHGYYACVSFVDAQIGKVLDELDRLGLADNTIVVLWGDHGWNLGDHTMWCKHSCFESSVHAPLIVVAPGIEGGRQTNGLVEFIDIYPSLCELCGLPAPDHLEGRSFAPLMKNPEMPWKDAAISRFGQGDTIRTDRYRFSEYGGIQEPRPRMLYDHETDPIEDVNVSERPENAEIVKELTQMLRQRKGKPFSKKADR